PSSSATLQKAERSAAQTPSSESASPNSWFHRSPFVLHFHRSPFVLHFYPSSFILHPSRVLHPFRIAATRSASSVGANAYSVRRITSVETLLKRSLRWLKGGAT